MGADVIDIAAPGGDSTDLVGQREFFNGVYGGSGTSYSAPFVAGTAALVLSAAPSLRGHWDQLRVRILDAADKDAISTSLGRAGTTLVKDGNRLNVCKAVTGGECPVAPFKRDVPDAGATDSGPADASSCDAAVETCPEGQQWNTTLCRCTVIIS
jgi:subtilisin family serine protease